MKMNLECSWIQIGQSLKKNLLPRFQHYIIKKAFPIGRYSTQSYPIIILGFTHGRFNTDYILTVCAWDTQPTQEVDSKITKLLLAISDTN